MIDDGYIDPVITDLTTVTILAINDAPVPVDDAYTTPENQATRILADATLLPPADRFFKSRSDSSGRFFVFYVSPLPRGES